VAECSSNDNQIICQADMNLRIASIEDMGRIKALYRRVAMTTGGLARTAEEINSDYVANFFRGSFESGIEMVAEIEADLIGEIHAYGIGPKVFSHCLGNLTIVVDPRYEGHGIGKQLFKFFLEHIERMRSDILRVELIARESNQRAIELYESLGFVKEGRLERRIHNHHGSFEADIPMAWFNSHFSANRQGV